MRQSIIRTRRGFRGRGLGGGGGGRGPWEP